MRLAISAALGGLLVAFVSPAADPKGEAVTKEQIEADLKLVPKVFGDTRVVEAGTQPYIEFALVNTSKTRAHKVVKPGDGSSDGRRDPWVHVTAEQRTVEGGWAAMRGHVPAGCGLFDWDWLKDVIELKPGEESKLADWYHPSEFEFQYPGKVRLTGHYAYRAAVLASAAARITSKTLVGHAAVALHPGVVCVEVGIQAFADCQNQAIDRVPRSTFAFDPAGEALGLPPVPDENLPLVQQFELAEEQFRQSEFILISRAADELEPDRGESPVVRKLLEPLPRLGNGRRFGTHRLAARPPAVPYLDQHVRVEYPVFHRPLSLAV